jgi:hypothetical protein
MESATKIKRKYVLIGGSVAIGDYQTYVSPARLSWLYKVPMEECFICRSESHYEEKGFDKLPDAIIRLRPQEDGEYTLPIAN